MTETKLTKLAGDSFLERRGDLNLTQRDVALKTGLALATIQRYEQGEGMTLPNFCRICWALDLNPADELRRMMKEVRG